MKRLRHCLLLLSLVHSLYAQPKLARLGPFELGVTTPDSVHWFAFREQELVVVKGTLALPCATIRVLKADTVHLPGLAVTNVALVFYENRLFRITCDYKDRLQQKFTEQHGKGRAEPPKTLLVCEEQPARRLTLERASWQQGDVRALTVRATGYNAQCRPEQTARLTITNQRIAAITSECDLEHLDPYGQKSWRER